MFGRVVTEVNAVKFAKGKLFPKKSTFFDKKKVFSIFLLSLQCHRINKTNYGSKEVCIFAKNS